MKKRPLAALFGTACIYLSASPIVLAEDATELEEIVVTADRKARTVDETLAPVTIITRQDIEKYQANDIADVLRRVPGVNIKNDGGAGKNTSVFLRGTNSNHVLVLVDGEKIGSVTATGIPFQHIPLDQVERIEVVRGPRSSLYGSEAVGGVIQIFTRKQEKGFHPSLSISAGSHDTQKARASLTGGNGTTWYNLGAGTEKTDGIDTCSASAVGCFPNNPDPDGYRRESASLNAGHRFANGTDVEINLLRAQGKVESDGYYQQTNVVEQLVSGKVRHPINDSTLLSARLGQVQEKADNFGNNGVFMDMTDSKRNSASLQADIQVSSASNLTLGVDQQKDKLKATSTYTKTSRKNTGMFASYQHSLGNTDVEVSARQDDNEQFGKHNTGSLAVAHELANGMRLKASYGTAFRTPTFDDMYYSYSDPWFTYVPNPDIQPEKSRNTEVGISGKLPNGEWEANVFNNNITNLITNTFDPATSVGSVANVNQARIQGVELIASSKLAGWDVQGNLTLQNPEDRQTGNTLIYRPTAIASIDADRDLGTWRVGATLHGEDKRHADAANATQLPGYGTLDLRASRKLAKDWTIGAKIGNVLDKQYETNRGYNQDGINGLVTVTYAPQ